MLHKAAAQTSSVFAGHVGYTKLSRRRDEALAPEGSWLVIWSQVLVAASDQQGYPSPL